MGKQIEAIGSDILNGKTSKFEAIAHINSIIDNETLEFFLEEFKEFFDEVTYDFISSFSEKQLIDLFDFIETNKDFMFDNGLSQNDIQTIKNYIIISNNVYFYFDEEADKTKYDISEIDMTKISIHEVEELFSKTPRETINKMILIGKYLISFNVNSILNDIHNGYDNEKKKRFDYIYDVYQLAISKTGEIKLLKSIYDHFHSKKNSISNKLIDYDIDLSDTNATGKVIYLQKLGVIDFLRTKKPFNTSINSLATVLSAVTGEKSGTIQPMLNAMLSKNVVDKNNPLNSKKAVSKVDQQLIKNGFEPN